MMKTEYFVRERPQRIPTHPGSILREDISLLRRSFSCFLA